MLLKISEFIKPTNNLKKHFKGVVVDNNDPKKLKRVKVEVSGLFEGIKENLPWCYQEGNDSTSSPSAGRFYVPDIGDEVEVYFPSEDVYAPFYRSNITNVNTKILDFEEEYPKKFGFVDGIKYFYNRETKLLEIIHPSGTKVDIKEDGSLDINSAKDIKGIATGNVSLDGSGGKLKLGGGKVAMGSTEELVAMTAELAQLCSEAMGNLGYPLSNSADFVALKARIDSIKGSL